MIRQLVFPSQSYSVSTVELILYTDARVGRDGRGANSYDCEKDWFSVNHSVLSDFSLKDIIHKGSGHNVYIYLYRVPQCLSPRPNWDPWNQRGGGYTFACVWGLGESQFRRLEKKLSTLSTLWEWVTKRQTQRLYWMYHLRNVPYYRKRNVFLCRFSWIALWTASALNLKTGIQQCSYLGDLAHEIRIKWKNATLFCSRMILLHPPLLCYSFTCYTERKETKRKGNTVAVSI